MKKDIRLIALDLDGTTFNSKKEITPRTRRAIMRAAGKGVIVMPASGRTLSGLPEAFTGIPGVRYALTSNGAAVCDLQSGRVLISHYIPLQTARYVMDRLLTVRGDIGYYAGGIAYSDRAGYERVISEGSAYVPWYKKYIERTRTPVSDMKGLIDSGIEDLEKFVISFDNDKDNREAFARLKDLQGVNVVYGAPFNMEIGTADKGQTLLDFAGRMGISREQVMACGDTDNDRTMIETAGFAVAMGNADQEIKDAADYVTLDNDRDGVACAIEKFVLDGNLTGDSV